MKHVRTILALDIGTTSIRAAVAELGPQGPAVHGFAAVRARGMRKGGVVHIDEVAGAVRKAVEEASSAAGAPIRSIHLAVAGRGIRGLTSSGTVALRGREITGSDRDRAVECARSLYIPLDREILHVIPTGFSVDGTDGISDPVGMSGVRLDAAVHVITCAGSHIENLGRACRRAGCDVTETMYGPLAAASAVLTEDELEDGVALVDMGGGTTSITLFVHGALAATAVIAVGGDHISNDLAHGLSLSIAEAEDLKVGAGVAAAAMANRNAEIPAGAAQEGRAVPVMRMAEIIEARCEEMLSMISAEITPWRDLGLMPNGVVLTGGGSLLRGLAELAAPALKMPVRRESIRPAVRFPAELRSAQCATVRGVIMQADEAFRREGAQRRTGGVAAGIKQMGNRLSTYFGNLNSIRRKEGGLHV